VNADRGSNSRRSSFVRLQQSTEILATDDLVQIDFIVLGWWITASGRPKVQRTVRATFVVVFEEYRWSSALWSLQSESVGLSIR
jgi:hypothetical protein